MSGKDYIGEPDYPAPWATSLPLEGLRAEHQAIIVSLAPDVCRSASVPVPYPVVDFCDHAENYTTSVRFTGQQAMVMRSSTSHVHGDEPGVGKGIKSGTVQGISEPIGHASQVRAEGSNVIRHLDRFYMNNRNTVGEALFVRDAAPRHAPTDDDPIPGSLVMNAAAQPAPQIEPVPAPPPGEVIRPNIPQWNRPPPIPEELPPVRVLPLLLRLGKFAGIAGAVAAALWPEKLGDGTLPLWFNDLYSPDPFRKATAEEAQRRYRAHPTPTYRHQVEEWYRDQIRDRPAAPPQPAQETTPAPQPAPDTVRVTEREEYRKKCQVDRYAVMKNVCGRYGMQAHHIVPDWTLRYGVRDDRFARIPNMPSLNDGMAICVMGNAREDETEHNYAHAADGAIEDLGLNSRPPYTATVAEVKTASQAAMISVRPDCAMKIIAATEAQFASINQNQLLRAKQYPPLPSETVAALRSGAVRSGGARP